MVNSNHNYLKIAVKKSEGTNEFLNVMKGKKIILYPTSSQFIKKG